MFGEVSALLGSRSDVSFVCKNYCKLGSMDIQEFQKIELVHPKIKVKMNSLLKS